MNQPKTSTAKTDATAALPGAASELNNLLQIVSGTVAQLENIWEGTPASEKYFEMLRTSVDRAANVTAQLMKQVGGTDEKKLPRPALASVPKPPSAAALPKRCVLVVDDEPMALMLTKLVLSQAGFAVVTAQSGFEALDLFQKSPGHFALVLLDLSMPILDGEETFRRLRRMDPDITVLLNTGFIEKHHLERMVADGLAGFIRRPYEPAEVIAQIESVLAQKSAREAAVSAL